ncbi:MAG: OmpA family protein [Spirochaetaceae bacterium]|jgi:outer membrane protein OmpA-like peptidoglycan-associated protein|nr:OmpA family protein [Spirochaetaceae bacterium]
MGFQKWLLPLAALAAFAAKLPAEEFAYKYRNGDKFRILSEVTEEYYLNGALSSTSSIHNRISTEVTGIQSGKALHKALFQVMVNKTAADGSQSLNITNEYTSLFERDTLGKMSVNRRYAFPSVRNVPVFPARNVNQGETWVEKGEEVHDMQGNFGLKDLLRLPFDATYIYLGEKTWRDKTYPAFSVRYRIRQQYDDYFEKSPRNYLSKPAGKNAREKDINRETVITLVTGDTNQTIYWDRTLGQPAASSGEFKLRFTMSDGSVHEFRSREEAEILYSQEMNKDAVAADLEKELHERGLTGASVKKVENGISINIENIQFEGDSAVLRQSEKAKLDKIAALLAKYPDRDILVAGHTAAAGGSTESHRKLSEDRAAAVAGYLVRTKVREASHIMTKGFGSSQPIATNATGEGREKNRRVELILLEN